MSSFQLSMQFFLQIAVILAACRVVGLVARRCGQPQVVGEMVAGILLGPSLFGLLAPAWQAAIFPATMVVGGEGASSGGVAVRHPLMAVIYCFAQVGLVGYMFLVGLSFRGGLIHDRMKSAVAVAVAGIVAPFVLGGAVAYVLRDHAAVFKPEVWVWESVMFLGAAMSITAFPMLARIIHERGLSGTSLGTLTLAAASSEDAVAWCILAVVLASFKSDSTVAVLAIGGGVAYTAVMLTMGRRVLGWMVRVCRTGRVMKGSEVPLILTMLMVVAWYSDFIGIHAVFGAFIFGVAVPRGEFGESLRQKLEPMVLHLLLPVFFVYSGLNTKITLVNTLELWAIAGLLLVVAVMGKALACYAAARLTREPHREAMAIGVLMNARGLTELIILNIGREFGIITDELFSMMVAMAIVTTLMATPVFELVYGRDEAREKAMREASAG